MDLRAAAGRRSYQLGALVAAIVAIALVLVAVRRDDPPTRVEAIEDTTTSSSTTTMLEDSAVASTTTSTAGPTTTALPVASGTCPTVDRDRILFHRTYQDPPRWHVFAVNDDGSCLRQLTTGDAHVLNWGASWSPDGTQIAFVRKDAGVIIANADGSNEQLVMKETKVQPSAAHTDWSPDGRLLAIGREDGVWVLNVTSGAAFNLAEGINNINPNWSPDGNQVVYWASEEGAVKIVNADGTGRRTLADKAAFPDWSSTNRIVMQREAKIVTMRPDGSDVRTLPVDGDVVGMPNWNRRGTKIVVSDGPGSIFVMNADGSDFHRLPLDPGVTADGW